MVDIFMIGTLSKGDSVQKSSMDYILKQEQGLMFTASLLKVVDQFKLYGGLIPITMVLAWHF